ncbi:MAG: excinuclease ABC subunit UvrA [Chthoniobacterales bacterium]
MPAPVSTNQDYIRIKGARVHNLRNIDVEIPRHQLVVITGLSGSGKSSLAFDTLFAEGQRKYVESLSAYARQFLDQMQKPEVDYIEGLSPAIAIEQRTSASNPRSTIATTTEIYDYLRILFSAIGRPHDPQTGEAVTRHTPEQITDILLSHPEGTRLILLAPLVRNQKGEFRDVIEKARREGFVRIRIDGEIVQLDTPKLPRPAKEKLHSIEAVVDRLVLREALRQRLSDSVETALRWGENLLFALVQPPDAEDYQELRLSTDFCNPNTDFTLPRLTPKHFSFNSHLGACPECHGIGTQSFVDPDLLLDESKTLTDNAVKPWKSSPKRMHAYYKALAEGLLEAYEINPRQVARLFSESFREVLFYGSGEREIQLKGLTGKSSSKVFEGLVPQVERIIETSESELMRNRMRAFTGTRPCPACAGGRLQSAILAVTLTTKDGKNLNIHDFTRLTIRQAARVIESLELSETQVQIVADVVTEIRQRLQFLDKVGLGYLALNRESGTLSGGESQRIRLATQIGSGLSGVLYVLDEPSIGLHQRDNDRLIETLRRLRDLGNSVVVVEHDEDTIRTADYILDMGPGAGVKGGQVVAQGSLSDILKNEHSVTMQYLTGGLSIPVPKVRKPAPEARPNAESASPGDGWITVVGASENNLKNLTVSFPTGCLTCVTGISGSGKSTLVNDILRVALARELNGAQGKPGRHQDLIGTEQLDKVIVIDQSAVGRTPRSNPATYSGAMGPIRDLFAQLPVARVRGYDAGRFSFNVKGGRCEHCQGDGSIKVEMHFLADVYVPCEVCRGQRYNRETLEITYKGKNISDILNMTVDAAARFFRHVPTLSPKLESMLQVGLGYLCLGQSATTLSGGEAQRLKLATELAKKSTGRTCYLLDEPTTGLHFADIHQLLRVLLKLRDAGNTLIVIEHNLEVVKTADWIIDLGPDGGEAGGHIVAEGTPEQVVAMKGGYTAEYLQKYLT